MKKVLAVKCNKCNDIIFKNSECACKNVGVLNYNKFFRIYVDDDNTIELIYAYVANNKVEYFINTLFKDMAVYAYLDFQKVDI